MNLSFHRHQRVLRTLSQLRCFSQSTCRHTEEKLSSSIYISRSTNPYFNLSVEDWLFRKKDPKDPLLLIYKDEPCVVIGRNQNPWKEVNLHLAQKRGIPFIRRRSGGGTVFHDLGNTNYSIHLPRTAFDRNETAKIVVAAVRSLGVDAYANDRNDICADGFKISSAYKIVNNRAYHHGTMLISTQLDALTGLLHTTKDTMIAKGVASVRSPVQNLQYFDPVVTHDKFTSSMVKVFQDHYDIKEQPQTVDEDEKHLNIPMIKNGITELKSWDWMYGQTPEFTYSITRGFEWGRAKAEIVSKHGIILRCTLSCEGLGHETLDSILKLLTGSQYGFLRNLPEHDQAEMPCDEQNLRRAAVWKWIREETS